MKLSTEKLLEIAQYSLVRMDGAWFLALAGKFGKETAWELDIEAWKHFSYVFGKKIRKDIIPHPVWPESFLDALEILSKILKTEGRRVLVGSDTITVQVTDCETQKAIAKAGIADCGIVTVQSCQELMRGLFGKGMDVSVRHTKNLNQGDDCCEVVISRHIH
ncbi:MAG: L-2-amino-thiazoline-4-carboxylic acid hydrolase [Desulfobacterales bacterium]|nr:L-2-amino-thiazoline-4-carboxylic acid hydrolase [Desulfobacterales bacterium]